MTRVYQKSRIEVYRCEEDTEYIDEKNAEKYSFVFVIRPKKILLGV